MMGHDESKAPTDAPIDPNDRSAMNALVDRYLPWIQSQVRRRLGSHLRLKVESGDIVQDALMRFLRYCPRLPRVDERGFCALMTRIVENSIRDQHGWMCAARRNPEREVTGEEAIHYFESCPTPDASPSAVLRARESAALAHFAVSLLQPIDRYVMLSRLEKMPYREIAERVGMSEDAVMSRNRRAGYKLTKLVEKLEKGDWRSIDWLEVDAEPPESGARVNSHDGRSSTDPTSS